MDYFELSKQLAKRPWRVDLKKVPFLSLRSIPWIIWGIVGMYYFFEIILRVLPSTMKVEFINSFQINATQFGLFTSIYYFAYVLMQIPAGLIVDRYSIRKTLFMACVLCMSGLVIVHSTSSIWIAYLGRFIIGFGSAFAYVYTLKVASIWLPKHRFGLATCIADSLGMVGAMFADIVFVKVNISYGTHVSVTSLVIAGSVIAMLIFFVFRDKVDTKKNRQLNANETSNVSNIFEKVAKIIKNPQVWLIGLVGCLFYLPASVIGDVWGIPFLQSVYHMTQKSAGYMISAFFFGWVIAGPFLGAFSDRMGMRVIPMQITILLNAILMSLVIFLPWVFHIVLPFWLLFFIFFLIGVSTGTHPLVFALAKENFKNRIAGTVVAVINTLTMIGGLVFQPLVGYLLDWSHGSLDAIAAVHNYTANNYTFALAIVPIALWIAFFVMFSINETGSKEVA